jgi:putative transposase
VIEVALKMYRNSAWTWLAAGAALARMAPGRTPLANGELAMTRRARRLQWTEAACYHVINRGHNRETVFANDEDRRYFLHLLDRYRRRFDLRVYHYCLMSNHFHIAVQVRACRHLSPLMAGLLRSYVHYFNRQYGFVGHLWQGRFKSPAIGIEEYLLSCGRYIERNPLDAWLVAQPWDWRWSSCRYYALGEPDELLTANPYYLEMAPEPTRRQERWRAFLSDHDPKEEAIGRQDWLLGQVDLRRETQDRHSRPAGRGRGRPARPLGAFPAQPSRPAQEK